MSELPKVNRHDVGLLAHLDESTIRVARERLNGSCGDETGTSARLKVAAFRAEAQQRMAATGMTAKEAELALLAERDQLPDAVFPEVRPRKSPWENLYGVRVRCERTACGYTQVREGVILPSVTRHRHQLRLGLTAATPRQPVGSVLTIQAHLWHITPDPLEVRHIPSYARHEVPHEVLATVAELTSRRLTRTREQPALATLMQASGRRELYAIVDAAPMLASEQAKSSAQLRRTCRTCSRISRDALPKASDGRHYCQEHHRVTEERWERAMHQLGRAVSTIWARQVLADPRSIAFVLVESHDRILVRMEELDGTVRLAEDVPVADAPSDVDLLLGHIDSETMPDWLRSPELLSVMQRRLLVTCTFGADKVLAKMLAAANGEQSDHLRLRHLYPAASDFLRLRHDVWLGSSRSYDRNTQHHLFGLEYHGGWFARPPKEGYDPRELAAQTRHRLTSMAQTGLTAEQESFATTWLATEPGNTSDAATEAGWSRRRTLKRTFLTTFSDSEDHHFAAVTAHRGSDD